jgi:hypothetical protein
MDRCEARELRQLTRIAGKLESDAVRAFLDRDEFWVKDREIVAHRSWEGPSEAGWRRLTTSEVRDWLTGRVHNLRQRTSSLLNVATCGGRELSDLEMILSVRDVLETKFQVGYHGLLWEDLPEWSGRDAWWRGFGDDNRLFSDVVTITDGTVTPDHSHDADPEEYAGKGLWTGEFEEGDTLLDYRRELDPSETSNSYVFIA